MTPDTPWKRSERRVATILGGKRQPVSGRARGSAPDIAHAHLSIEVKHRRLLPAWILTALAQARASQVSPDQLAIAVLHQHGTRFNDSLVVMTLKDFTDWHGPLVTKVHLYGNEEEVSRRVNGEEWAY